MRRENRYSQNKDNFRKTVYLSVSILGIAITTFLITFFIYGGVTSNNEQDMNIAKVTELMPNSVVGESAEASSEIGKTVNELQHTLTIDGNVIDTSSFKNETNTNKTDENTTIEKEEAKPVEVKEEEKKPDPTFVSPVEGEMMREYAKETLVYSETLKEWVTHLGIDIKADKTAVVKASAAGTVESIKNDPRFGLTVVIVHDNGFKSIYSNLLTAEFVTEGEKLEAEQTIGTIGNTAAFEILDEPHLHFEITKDGEYLDPNIYINL